MRDGIHQCFRLLRMSFVRIGQEKKPIDHDHCQGIDNQAVDEIQQTPVYFTSIIRLRQNEEVESRQDIEDLPRIDSR